MKVCRSLFVGWAILLIAACSAQIKMSMMVGGKAIGTCVAALSIDSSGYLTQTLSFTIAAAGQKVTQEDVVYCDAKGRPVRESVSITQMGQKQMHTLQFMAKKVQVTTNVGKNISVKDINIPKGNLEDASTLWFVKTRPKVGAVATYLHLDINNLTWETRSAIYVGDEVVPGLKVKGHHIRQKDNDTWVDDKGLPLRLEQKVPTGKIVLLRN